MSLLVRSHNVHLFQCKTFLLAAIIYGLYVEVGVLWDLLIAQVDVGLENDDWDSTIGELADIDHALLC